MKKTKIKNKRNGDSDEGVTEMAERRRGSFTSSLHTSPEVFLFLNIL